MHRHSINKRKSPSIHFNKRHNITALRNPRHDRIREKLHSRGPHRRDTEKRGAILVFDPHGEYKNLTVEGSQTRVYGVKGKNKIRVETSSLRTGDYTNLIPDLTEAQRDLLEETVSLAKKFYDKYDLDAVKTYSHASTTQKTDGNS